MSRRQRGAGRGAQVDPRYESAVVTRFINNIMRDGKRSLVEAIFYDAMEILEEKTGQPPLEIFEQAIDNVRPVLEVKSRRVGGATYQVPVEVRPERRTTLAMKWIAQFAKQRNERTMAERLAGELLAASRNEGSAVRKKDDMHRMAEANKAFAHYRW